MKKAKNGKFPLTERVPNARVMLVYLQALFDSDGEIGDRRQRGWSCSRSLKQ